MSFERLMREHDALETMARALLNMIDAETSDADAAASLLLRFAAGVREHRAFEQGNVYRPLIEAERNGKLSEPLQLDRLVLEMDGDWPAYLDGWDARRIATDWPAFADASRRHLTRALERLRLENGIIYPLALKHGAIRLRDVA